MERRVSLAIMMTFAVAAVAGAQSRPAIDPQTLDLLKIEAAFPPVVRGAPYSGEGITTTTQTLADGTRIERTVHARFYRDADGRTRREQTILGLGPLGESRTVTIVDPIAGVMYGLNPATHEGRRSPIPAGAGRPAFAPSASAARRGEPPPPPPPPPAGYGVGAAPDAPPPPPPPPPGVARRARAESGVPNMPEPLGTKQLEGLTVVGTKRTEVIPTGRIGNDRPIEITDERWESPDLKVLVMSRHHDPRTGDVEYRLTNVLRTEPPRDLFQPPADYAIVDAPPPPPPPPRRPEGL
jgi:hypothetical protein